MTSKLRLDREKDFHDDLYASNARHSLEKYYQAGRSGLDYFETQLLTYSKARSVLDYGCGTGYKALLLARTGAPSRVTGIDLSVVGVQEALKSARHEGISIASFVVGDAERLSFADETFDFVYGAGILHHLDLRQAFSEIGRVLRSDGHAVFIEPLGHNPFINLFRRLTPRLRTTDEHPLLIEHLDLVRERFSAVDAHFFCLLPLLLVPLRRIPGFGTLLRLSDAADYRLFRWLPFVSRYAWMVVIEFSRPRGKWTSPQRDGPH